jgi:hypothetical protein
MVCGRHGSDESGPDELLDPNPSSSSVLSRYLAQLSTSRANDTAQEQLAELSELKQKFALCLSKTTIYVRKWDLYFFVILSRDARFCHAPCHSVLDRSFPRCS